MRSIAFGDFLIGLGILFVLEGIPTTLVGILIYRLLSNRPAEAVARSADSSVGLVAPSVEAG